MQKKIIKQVSNVDIKKLPPEFDDDFLDAINVEYVNENPSFYA
jgi:hypothetical protein